MTMFYPLFLCCSLAIAATNHAHGITHRVYSNQDDGPGSLRQAVTDINLNGVGQDNVIWFGARGTITLDSELLIKVPVLIAGPGIDQLTISGQGKTRLFRFDNGNDTQALTMEIRDLTLINGSSPRHQSGGGIYNKEALTLTDVTLRGHAADLHGGALANAQHAELIMTGVKMTGNSAQSSGGALYSRGQTSVIEDSEFAGNVACLGIRSEHEGGGAVFLNDAPGTGRFAGNLFKDNHIHGTSNNGSPTRITKCDGGAILLHRSNMELTDSTLQGNSADDGGAIRLLGTVGHKDVTVARTLFADNTAAGSDPFAAGLGGAIFAEAHLNLKNVTITGNTATRGGGIYANSQSYQVLVALSFVTLADNNATVSGGGLDAHAFITPVFEVRNSVLAGNTVNQTRSNCAQPVADNNNPGVETGNFADDASCGFGLGNNATIRLGPLMNSGGATATRALLDRPSIDGTSDCKPFDPIVVANSIGTVAVANRNIATDQRGFLRIGGTTEVCDAGATETSPDTTCPLVRTLTRCQGIYPISRVQDLDGAPRDRHWHILGDLAGRTLRLETSCEIKFIKPVNLAADTLIINGVNRVGGLAPVNVNAVRVCVQNRPDDPARRRDEQIHIGTRSRWQVADTLSIQGERLKVGIHAHIKTGGDILMQGTKDVVARAFATMETGANVELTGTQIRMARSTAIDVGNTLEIDADRCAVNKATLTQNGSTLPVLDKLGRCLNPSAVP